MSFKDNDKLYSYSSSSSEASKRHGGGYTGYCGYAYDDVKRDFDDYTESSSENSFIKNFRKNLPPGVSWSPYKGTFVNLKHIMVNHEDAILPNDDDDDDDSSDNYGWEAITLIFELEEDIRKEFEDMALGIVFTVLT